MKKPIRIGIVEVSDGINYRDYSLNQVNEDYYEITLKQYDPEWIGTKEPVQIAMMTLLKKTYNNIKSQDKIAIMNFMNIVQVRLLDSVRASK